MGESDDGSMTNAVAAHLPSVKRPITASQQPAILRQLCHFTCMQRPERAHTGDVHCDSLRWCGCRPTSARYWWRAPESWQMLADNCAGRARACQCTVMFVQNQKQRTTAQAPAQLLCISADTAELASRCNKRCRCSDTLTRSLHYRCQSCQRYVCVLARTGVAEHCESCDGTKALIRRSCNRGQQGPLQ